MNEREKKKSYLREKMESNRLNITKYRSNFNRYKNIPGDVSIEWKQIDARIRLNCETNKKFVTNTLKCRASEMERVKWRRRGKREWVRMWKNYYNHSWKSLYYIIKTNNKHNKWTKLKVGKKKEFGEEKNLHFFVCYWMLHAYVNYGLSAPKASNLRVPARTL